MKKRFKTPNSFKLKNIISITIILIAIITINFFVSYNNKMSAGLAEVALTKIEEISNSIINESFSREIFGDILGEIFWEILMEVFREILSEISSNF